MDTETTLQFHIKHDVFEGPLEVLLELVEKRKLFVNDISLAQVTDDFISHIQSIGMHPDTVTSFLSVAATLILIKARSLLPNIELTQEEEQSIESLEKRLLLLQSIQSTTPRLIQRFRKKTIFLSTPPVRPISFVPPEKALSLEVLRTLISEIIKRVPPPPVHKPEARVYKTISIREVIDTITERIQKALSCSFKDICVTSPDGDSRSAKVYTIVSFLGMLELVRQGIVSAEQEMLFEDIHLQHTNQESNKVVQ